MDQSQPTEADHFRIKCLYLRPCGAIFLNMHSTGSSRPEAGFTLLELIIALALTAILVVSSFVDGHAETKRWQSATSCYPVQFYYPTTRAFDAFGRNDYAWYLARTGWVQASTGQGAFGY